MVEMLCAKIEKQGEKMKVKENCMRVFGAVIGNLRDILSTPEKVRMINCMNYSLEQEALQIESFKALENFMKNQDMPFGIDAPVTASMNQLVQILLNLFNAKGRHFKIAI